MLLSRHPRLESEAVPRRPRSAARRRRYEKPTEEKRELEHAIAEAFERKDNREGRRLNRRPERVRSILDDLYEQWTVKAS